MTLSPPPIVPLSTPTLNPSLSTPHPSRDGPVIVPNEKSLRRRRPASRQSSLLAATLRPEKQPVSLTYTSTSASTNTGSMVERSPQMSGSGQSPSQWAKPPSFSPELPPSGPAASRLSSVTFSPPPLPSHSMSPDRSKQPSLSPAVKPVHNFTPTFHASSVRAAIVVCVLFNSHPGALCQSCTGQSHRYSNFKTSNVVFLCSCRPQQPVVGRCDFLDRQGPTILITMITTSRFLLL